MAYNPSTSRAECNYHAGLVNQDSKNQPQTSNRESYNTFDKRHLVFDTQLFDEVRPFYMDPANSGDVKRARMINNDWSPVTKSQILSTITKHRALFQVPWSVIMPKTWEYILREPVQGEDISSGNVLPLINKSSLVSIIRYIFNWNVTTTTPDVTWLEAFLKNVWLYYNMFGASGLPHSLGVRIVSPDAFKFRTSGNVAVYDCSPESVFTRLCDAFGDGLTVTVGGSDVTVGLPSVLQFKPSVVSSSPSSSTSNYSYEIKYPSDMFNFMRDFIWYAESETLQSNVSLDVVDYVYLFAYVLFGVKSYDSAPGSSYVSTLYISAVEPYFAELPSDYTYNVAPIIAYQCIWHQFFTNDRVDAFYSSRMWQDNVFTHALRFSGSGDMRFLINGVNVVYDAYSAAVINAMVSVLEEHAGVDQSRNISALDYFNELFSIRPSMRGSDYFTSMRAQPLAVGDVNVSVNGNLVSAIDINKTLWYQRFLNAVNRTKQSIYDYLQSITGVLPQRREPQPNFILEETYRLSGMEIENNAEKQGSIVSILRNTSSDYVYDVFIDEPSFVIGLDSYSVNYVYPDSCHKVAEMSDRLDWFNDFMQHIGDQQVSVRELFTPSSLESIDNPIGYQLRYAQFKNMISRASGGFIVDDSDLSSWLLMYCPNTYLGFSVNQMCQISPYFIRNHAADFDNLFASLTGYSPATRYHVIKAVYVDELDNSKQQAYPSLL